jgi:ATP-dependent exoDNAse (exonuclease V) beta subunit
MGPDEIKEKWDTNGRIASDLGTKLHKYIELFYNGELTGDEKKTDDIEIFYSFYDKNKHLKPYRTEWEVYDEDHDIAGSIDMVFENEDGSLSIYDWKRCVDIKKENKWENANYPIQHLPDSNFWHYSLQLNIYKYILETKYKKRIRDMYLVCIHPCNDDYKLYKVDSLDKEIQIIFS